ncbi:MAG: methylenetetrahydrofolate reductase C-terminal domain-containing protein [Thermodesulfobacteriota bacterium]
MIITKKKDPSLILEYLDGRKKVYLFGCNSCAEQCQTGGKRELDEMTVILRENGKEITGTSLIDETCYKMLVKKEFKANEAIMSSDAILVLACGAGVKTVAEIAENSTPVFPALDSLFLASVERYGRFFEGCSLCGECILGSTAGICPHTLCPKGLLNGPCGGVINGRCEVNIENNCVWVDIFKRLKAQDRLNVLKKIHPPKDYSNGVKPRKVILERKKTRV